jgi:phosphate-selective porin
MVRAMTSRSTALAFVVLLGVGSPTVARAQSAAAPPVETGEKAAADEKKAEKKAPDHPAELRARLDYSDGAFYLRSADDKLVIIPSGRMHIDTYAWAGPGAKDYQRGNGTGLKANMFFRRFILEMGGLVRGKWFFWMGGNFAPTRIDDNQQPVSAASVYDGWIGYDAAPELKIQGGQFNIPVSMENVTSSRWLDLMERSFTARLAAPFNKDIGLMAWGSVKEGLFDYQLAAVGGDGMNRFSVDNRWDVMPRVVFRPLAAQKGALSKLHVGASGRYGHRDPNYVFYEAPSVSTPGGFAAWTANYGSPRLRIMPMGAQIAVGGEAYVPFETFDLRGEFFYFNERRREADSTSAATLKDTLRTGDLKGTSWYVQASWWPLGTPRINGNPGNFGVPKLPKDLGKEAPYGVQLVARFEMVRLAYRGNSRAGSPGGLDKSTDNIDVNAYQFGVNYWATKHVRLTGEYSLYQTPGGPTENQALSPGAKANGNDPSARHFHEFSFRLGLSL